MQRNWMNNFSLFSLAITVFILNSCGGEETLNYNKIRNFVIKTERDRVLSEADGYLTEQPKTITAYTAERSAGGPHDFFSEGDYWWPDPENPGGPYVRRDGLSNPDNFVAHREMLLRFSRITAALTAAYKISDDKKYAKLAADHLRAWFVNESTRMNPTLQFAQAIFGRVTGRGVGIIDTIHLVEVARAVEILWEKNALPEDDYQAIRRWFADYLEWMTTHEYGIDERDRKNNHGTCWVMQVAAFSHLTGDSARLDYCRNRYRTVLLPNQVAPDGSYPLELARTKPYGYSLFNLDAMAAVCHMLTTPETDLWRYRAPESGSMQAAMEYMYPFIQDKSSWPLEPDVMYWEEWPVRHPALLFAAIAFKDMDYLSLWKELPPVPQTMEGFRNFPIRQPLLWI